MAQSGISPQAGEGNEKVQFIILKKMKIVQNYGTKSHSLIPASFEVTLLKKSGIL